MAISQIASCSTQVCQQFGFCNTPWFRSFVVEIELRLEERIVERSAIAASRATLEQTGALCDLSLMHLTQSDPHLIHQI